MELYTNCFLGVPLSQSASLQFKQAQSSLCTLLPAMTSADRWMPHITMYYLGSQHEDQLDDIMIRSVQSVNFLRGEQITIGSLGVFREHDPRVVYLQVQHSSRVEQFYRVLCEELSSFRVEQTSRDFHPHVTVGRLYSELSQEMFITSRERLQESAVDVQIEMEIERLCLFGIAEGKPPEILREEIL